MRRILTKISSAVLLCLSPFFIQAKAQTSVTSPLAFDLAMDARSSGLGGKIAGEFVNDGYMLAYNPAMADSTMKGRVYVSYLNYFAGIQGGAVSAVIANKGKLTLHSGYRFTSFGTFEGFDASGVPTSDFSGGDYFLQSGITYRADSNFVLGATLWGGFRNLALENSGCLGLDISAIKSWPNRHMSLGLLTSGLGRQFAGTGSQPVGWMPANIQLGFTKGFDHAPFRLFTQLNHLEDWTLTPEGTHDDYVDPLTGEVIENTTWVRLDEFVRHLVVGVELKFGENFSTQIGYDHRRRAEMIAAGRQGTNGLAIGVGMRFKDFDFNLARNTYHFSGSSTHLSISFNLPS